MFASKWLESSQIPRGHSNNTQNIAPSISLTHLQRWCDTYLVNFTTKCVAERRKQGFAPHGALRDETLVLSNAYKVPAHCPEKRFR